MTPAQAAYTEWTKSVIAIAVGTADQMGQVAAFLDAVTPDWDLLSEPAKAAWERIAQAAIDAPF